MPLKCSVNERRRLCITMNTFMYCSVIHRTESYIHERGIYGSWDFISNTWKKQRLHEDREKIYINYREWTTVHDPNTSQWLFTWVVLLSRSIYVLWPLNVNVYTLYVFTLRVRCALATVHYALYATQCVCTERHWRTHTHMLLRCECYTWTIQCNRCAKKTKNVNAVYKKKQKKCERCAE